MIAGLVLLQMTLAIAVAGPPSNAEYLPLRVAQAEGYFAQEQLSVRLDSLRAEAPAAQALARGHADLAATSLEAALTVGHSGGAPPRLVFGLTAGPPSVLLVGAAQKDTIGGVADLAGKVIGIAAPGTPSERVLLALLARARIGLHQVTIQSYGERGVAGALRSGAVAAAVIDDPWATELLESGQAVALADLRKRSEAARWLGADTVHAAVFARADTTLGPAALVPFARAMLRALARIRAATPEELAAVLPAAVIGPPETFARRVESARESFLPRGLVNAEMLGASVDLIRSYGPLPDKVHVPRSMSRLLFTDPLREALRTP